MASNQTDLSKHPATADGSSHDSDSSMNKRCVPDENCAGEEKVKGTSALDRSPQKVKKVSSAEEIKADESAVTQNIRDSLIKLTTGQDFVATAAICDHSEIETSHIHRSTSSKQDNGSTFDPLTTVHSLQFWEPLVCELHELTKDGYNKSSKSDLNEMLETVFEKMEELREGFLSLDDKIAKIQAEEIAAKCGFMTSMASFMAQVYKGKLLIVVCANICDRPRQNQPYCAGPQSEITAKIVVNIIYRFSLFGMD